MKIELTRAEVERIILNHVNAWFSDQRFNSVQGTSYRDLPDAIVISTKKEEDAAQ